MVSFIVPAYNATKTIKKSISSILNQVGTKLDYEIIIVDDGSKDNLRKKLNECFDPSELQYISYYRTENHGLSAARNYGVKKSHGDYLIFVDSDDFVSNKLLRDIELFINKNYDLIKWSPIVVNDGDILKTDTNEFEETTGEEGFNKLFCTDPLMMCAWNYAIKKDIFIEFPEGKYHEDFAVIPLMMLNAKTMVITDKLEYYYNVSQNSKSITKEKNKRKQKQRYKDLFENFDNLIKTTKENDDLLDYTKENVGIFACNCLLQTLKETKGRNRAFYKKELAKRNISQYIVPRNFKQRVKKIILKLLYSNV